MPFRVLCVLCGYTKIKEPRNTLKVSGVANASPQRSGGKRFLGKGINHKMHKRTQKALCRFFIHRQGTQRTQKTEAPMTFCDLCVLLRLY